MKEEISEKQMREDIGEVPQLTQRQMREAQLGEVAMRNFLHGMGYANLDDVPDPVKTQAERAFAAAFAGLDLPILNMEITAESVVLVGVDSRKYNKMAATIVVGKVKALLPNARIIAYDFNSMKINDAAKHLSEYLGDANRSPLLGHTCTDAKIQRVTQEIIDVLVKGSLLVEVK